MRRLPPQAWRAVMEEAHEGWLRRWVIWAAAYACGFLLLWIAAPSADWMYYGWAIGWVLMKWGWDRHRLHKAVERYTEAGEDGAGPL